ncbi:MAG TPA: hypothetical protein VGD01_15805 [Candidatus Elarobacter sp.]
MSALSACAGGSSGTASAPATPSPTATPVPVLSASPNSVFFGGTDALPSPQQVTVTSTSPLSGALTVAVSDPTAFGASAPVVSGTTATFAVYPISHGTTAAATLTVSGSGATPATVSASTWVCGRPDNLTPSTQLIFPSPGSTGNAAATTTTLYFMVTSHVAVSTVKLHLIVGTNGTLEGGTLVVAPPPPGAASPTPPSSGVVTYMRATVPSLQPSTTYATQLYDDTCQLPILAGSFST